MNDAPYSSNFFLYFGDIKLQHTVRTDGDLTAHVNRLSAALAALAAAGQTPSPVDLSDGCERQQVSGYVLAEDRNGDPILFCYCEPLEFRIHGGTIYHDKFDLLPFNPSGRKWPTSSPPSLAEARAKGYLQPVAMEIIVKNTGKQNDAGKDIYRFQGVSKWNGSSWAPPGHQAAEVSSQPVGQVSHVGEPQEPQVTDDEARQLVVGKIKRYITSHDLKTVDQLASAGDRALQLRDDLGEYWTDVQATFATRLTSFRHAAERAGRFDEMRTLTRKLQGVLPDGFTAQTIAEINAAEAKATAAADSSPANGQDFGDIPF